MIVLHNKKVIRHLIVWLLITIFLCIIDPVEGNIIASAIATLLIMLGYMFIFYAHYLFIFPKFYKTNNLKLIAFSITVYVILLIINYINFYYVETMFGDKGV